MRLWPIFLAAAPIAFGQYPGATKPTAAWQTGFESITVKDAKPFLETLAGPMFRGREPLRGDYGLAAGWLAARLQQAGLEPAADDGTFFHRFAIQSSSVDLSKSSLLGPDSQVVVPCGWRFSVSTVVDGTQELPGIVFVRIPSGGSLKPDQLKRLSGKIVLLRASPQDTGNLSQALRAASLVPYAVCTPNGRNPDSVVQSRKSTSIQGHPDPRRPVISSLSFSDDAMSSVAKVAGAGLFESGSLSEPAVEPSNVTFKLSAKLDVTLYPSVNVVAKVSGTDPVLSKEAVVVGSHLDHLGAQSNGTYFGADDNASGCTANFFIARAVVLNKIRPKRSVYFAFWSSEELGLLGSYAFVQRPTVNLSDIIAYINMDMVGRDENDPRFKSVAAENGKMVYPSGVAFNSPDFLKVLFDANKQVGLTLKADVEDRIMRSDSGSFAWKQIPTVKVFTGDHEDYHKTTDTPDKVNFEKMVNIAKWLYLTVQDLASGRARPRWQPSPFKPNPW